MYAHPYTDSKTRKKATLFVGVLMFFLTLSALNSVGLVPDYVDGTGGFLKEKSREGVFALPDENQQLALNEIPRLGDETVVRPISVLEEEARKVREEEAARLAALEAEEKAREDAIAAARARALNPIPAQEVAAAIPIVQPIVPTRVVIDEVSIDVPVLNPSSTEVSVLDEALHNGVVRYPLSAELNQEGNVFIFGHSSHLPVVKNAMYKALNGIEELSEGDTIKLEGKKVDGTIETHLYRVTSVRKTPAEEALIDLSQTGKRLTLSTCDSFGGKSSRWVVEAEFIGAF